MAVTATLVGQTHNSIQFLLAQDGGGGTTHTITAAQLLSAAIDGPIREMPGIGEDNAGLTTALARARMLGDKVASPDLINFAHCKVRLQARSGANVFQVDADTDAVNALRCELNVVAEAGAASAYLTVEYQGGPWN